MSIIQTIRDKAAPVTIGVIAISLIGFILMDAGRSGLGGGVSPKDAVVSVNGVDLSWEAFQQKVKLNEEIQQMQGNVVDENTRQQIYTETYNTIITDELLNQEYAKLGIDVSDKEFNDMLFGKNPPQWLTQQFTNDKGEFDVAAARQAINELKKNKANTNRDMVNNLYLNPMIEGTKRNKYAALLQNSSYVPKWMAEKTVADNSQMANMSYVVAPFSSVSDSAVKVSDADIMAYAKAHASEYETEEGSRSIAYVSFDASPSTQDTADVYNSLVALKGEFEQTTDAGAFVARNASTLPYFDGYNSKNRIQIAQKDSIIGAGIGKVYGPYLDVQSYVLSKVVDMKVLPDSVKARHILIGTVDPRTQQPTNDPVVAKKKADSLLAAIKGGADFTMLALMNSDDEGSKIKGGDLGYFANGAMVKEFNDFCFNKAKGAMDIVQTQFGYHIIQVTDQKDFNPAYKIAYLAKNIDASQTTINEAQLKANAFLSKSKDLKSFEATLSADKLTKKIAQDIKAADYQVGMLGVNRELVREIYKADVGDVLPEPFELNNQFLAIAITGEEPKGLPSVAKLRPMIESIVRNELKGKMLAAKLAGVTTLEAAAQKLNVPVLRADSVSFVSPLLGGSGYELKAGGFGFNKNNIGKISAPIIGGSGVFVVKPEAQFAQPVTTSVDEMMQTLMSQQKGALLYGSMEALRKTASVTDNRTKFL